MLSDFNHRVLLQAIVVHHDLPGVSVHPNVERLHRGKVCLAVPLRHEHGGHIGSRPEAEHLVAARMELDELGDVVDAVFDSDPAILQCVMLF